MNEAVLAHRFDFQHHLVGGQHSLVTRWIFDPRAADRNCRTEENQPKMGQKRRRLPRRQP
jgi:hypothetical protein